MSNGYERNPAERKAAIINYLYRIDRITTTGELATMFEVSTRTIERDLIISRREPWGRTSFCPTDSQLRTTGSPLSPT